MRFFQMRGFWGKRDILRHRFQKGVSLNLVQPLTKKKIIQETKKAMQQLGTYRKEFDRVIDIYSSLIFQYIEAEKQLETNEFKTTETHVNKLGFENEKKSPILSVMEALRKDILNYSDRLMLNPRSLGETVELKQESPLNKIFDFQKGLSNDS